LAKTANCESVAELLPKNDDWVVDEVFTSPTCVVVTVFPACAPADSATRAAVVKISLRIMVVSFRSLF